MRFRNPTPFQRDNVTGSAGTDEILTFSGDDTVHGEGGNDLINGGLGDDTLFGGGDNDIVIGGEDDDTLFGDDGDDVLSGGDGEDDIHGGNDDDQIFGGRGSDNLFGDDGQDTFIQHDPFGNDVIDGGNGFDTVDYNSTSARFSVKYTFGQFGFDDTAVMTIERSLSNTSSFPVVQFANQWTDTLDNIDRILTGAGNDTITGNDNINVVHAGGGNDVLRGRGSDDDMDGGAGNDTFIFESFTDSRRNQSDFGGLGGDLIRNFGDSAGNQDVIDLRAVDANLQAFARGNENFRADDNDGQIEAGELIITQRFDTSQDRLVSVAAADVDGNGGFDLFIRFDRVIATLDVSDFVL